MKKPIVIIGASSFGRLVQALLKDAGSQFGGFVDDYNDGNDILGTLDVLSDPSFKDRYDLALAIGYRHLKARRRIFHQCTERGFHFPSIVHPRAYVSQEALLGPACIVMAGANVDAFSEIRGACVLWPGAIVSHDCVVGENTFVSPNATICGFVHIGHSTFVGAGSTIVNGVQIPEASFIKASQRISRTSA